MVGPDFEGVESELAGGSVCGLEGEAVGAPADGGAPVDLAEVGDSDDVAGGGVGCGVAGSPAVAAYVGEWREREVVGFGDGGLAVFDAELVAELSGFVVGGGAEDPP